MNWKYYNPKFEYEDGFMDTGWPWSGHRYFAYDLISNIDPKTIVELGTHKGTSLFSFCQAVKDNKLKTKVYAIDTWAGDKQAGFYGDDIYKGVQNIIHKNYSKVSVGLLRMTFDEAVSKFQDRSIDILHIDGLHTFEAVKHDFDSWINKVSDNGVVLIHDIAVTKEDFGVYKLWEDLRKKYLNVGFTHSFGLGILYKGDKYFMDNSKDGWLEHYSCISDEVKNEKINNLARGLEQVSKKLDKKNQEINNKNKKIDELTGLLNVKEHEIAWMQSSKFWKLRNAYAKFKVFPRFGKIVYQKSALVYKREGFIGFLKSVSRHLKRSNGRFWIVSNPLEDYHKWILLNELTENLEKFREEQKQFKYRPKISIIAPVYNVSSKWLNKCFESVISQFYENWELCVHDDSSTSDDTKNCLRQWANRRDSRIKISYGKKNQHISGASNEALKMATGDFIALLDNDDELSSNALFENVKLLNEHPDTDMIYSDEDKIDEKGNRSDPFFKPGWTLDLMLSVMYTCHLGLYRKSIIDKIGGFRKGYEGAQDYDLVLRFIEKTTENKIRHIPKILYHWRMLKTSTALSSGSKNYAFEAGKKSISDYLKRNKIEGKVIDGVAPGFYRVIRRIKGDPLVSIIIPFRDLSDVLRRCVKSIKEKTNYKNYEILLVDNQSVETKTKKYLETLKDDPKIKIFKFNKPFNYSAINNFAAKKARGKYVLFLNNDTEVISEEWLMAMVEHIQREDVGAVGAKLLFPNDTVQHAGAIIGIGGVAGHIYHGYKKTNLGYMGQLNTIRNYNAVTAACMMVKKDLFEEIRGMDGKNLPIAFNDIDLCLKIREKGFKIIFTPYALLYHYESLSRGYDEDFQKTDPKKYKRVVEEREYFKKKWGNWLEKGDQYYNPNFSYGDDGKIWPHQVQAP